MQNVGESGMLRGDFLPWLNVEWGAQGKMQDMGMPHIGQHHFWGQLCVQNLSDSVYFQGDEDPSPFFFCKMYETF